MKKKKNASSILADNALPVLLCVASDTSASEVILRPFTVLSADGEETTFIANPQEDTTYSPTDGEEVTPLEGDAVAASTASAESTFPVIATCECGHVTRASVSLAVALDGTKIHCMHCASDLTAEYAGDFEEEPADDESGDILDNMDDGDATEDEELDLTEDEDAPEDEEEAGCKTKAGCKVHAEGEDCGEDCETPEDESMETDEEEESEIENDEELPLDEEPVEDAELAVLSTLDDLTGDLRLLRASSERLEVFLGDTHVGRINVSEASDNVKRIIGNDTTFRNAFSLAFYSDAAKVIAGEENTLSDFGFKAATVSVAADALVQHHVNAYKADIVEASERLITEDKDALLKTLKVAMAALNKGIFDGPNMVSAFANKLRSFGVKNAEAEAAKVVEASSEAFLSSAYDHALKLVEAGPDYTRGIVATVDRTPYKVVASEVSPEEVVAAAPIFAPRLPQQPVATVTASVDNKPSYRSIFAKMGRNRN